jgi:hypothetical protein
MKYTSPRKRSGQWAHLRQGYGLASCSVAVDLAQATKGFAGGARARFAHTKAMAGEAV